MFYSDDLKRAINIAQSIAKEYQNEQFTPSHLLLAILHNEIGLASMLAALGKDINYIRDWAEVRIEDLPKTIKVPEEPIGDEKVKKTIEMAELIAITFENLVF